MEKTRPGAAARLLIAGFTVLALAYAVNGKWTDAYDAARAAAERSRDEAEGAAQRARDTERALREQFPDDPSLAQAPPAT